MSLIEVLISVVVVSLAVAAAATGIITLTRSTISANDAARANVLVTGFGEALKRLPYVECTRPDLEDEYNIAFVDVQSSLPAGQRLLKANESAAVTDVEVTCAPVDPGVQTISFEVSSQSRTVTAEIVKRNPDFVDGLFPDFTATRLTAPGDALAIFQLDATASSPIARIVEYSFACGDDADTVVVFTDPSAPDAACEYPATGSASTRTITLTITDVAGRTRTATRAVTVPAVSEPRLAPTAVIRASCAPNPAAQCTSGTANPSLVVSFDASQSTSLQGSIRSYEWDFGDVDSGTANTATGVTASHTFTRSNNFQVRLTVTDDANVSSTTTLTIAVTRPGPPPPVARFTFTPGVSVAPQTISFNGTSSTTSTGGAVSSYQWNFGDGATSSEATPQRLYSNPGTYNVTLTVQDGSGVASSLSQQIVVSAFQPMPNNFRMTDATGCLLGLFCRGRFFFAWTNVPRSSTDNLDYEIQIRHATGQCFGFNTESRLARAGAPGTVQTYTYVVGTASDTCIWNTYEWRVRAIRSSPANGTTTFPWSGWSPWTISRVAW